MPITDRRLLGLAVAAKLASPAEVELFIRLSEPDPLEGLDGDERVEHVVRTCGSGIWAECPPPTVAVAGRPVAVPPGHRRRGRSPRGRSTDPPSGKTLTKEGTSS